MSLPFQVIEIVNESRATRQAKQTLTLFDYYEGEEGSTFEDGWKNKLIWGDNLLVMSSLLEKFAGKIDLIYIDPPFATGADFSFTADIGESGEDVVKEQSAMEEKAYRDTWAAGPSSFLGMLHPRLLLCRELLAPTGSIYVHMDFRLGPAVKVLMDEVFGRDNFRNEVVWYYSGAAPQRNNGRASMTTSTSTPRATGGPSTLTTCDSPTSGLMARSVPTEVAVTSRRASFRTMSSTYTE